MSTILTILRASELDKLRARIAVLEMQRDMARHRTKRVRDLVFISLVKAKVNGNRRNKIAALITSIADQLQ